VISQHLAAALKSSCHSRPAYQKQSRTGMRPSLLAGPQAGRDFREKAGNGAWPVQTYSTAQNAHCQQTVVFRQQTVVFPRPPQHWGPGRLGGCNDPAGWKAGDIRSKQFRHTYATARLQTTDRGAPVAAWTVAKELGHSGTAMLEKTYGHLGEVRHRSEIVRVPCRAARG